MDIQTISTKELREDFDKIKNAMSEGQSLLLLYRSKPLAKISPVKKKRSALRSFSEKEMKRWIKDDQLDKKQKETIKKIIDRLS